MKKSTFLLALAATLTFCAPVRAAFVVKQPAAIESTTSHATVAPEITTADETPEDAASSPADGTKKTKQYKRGNGVASFIVGLVGLGTAAVAISLLPVSLLGAVALGVVTLLLGFTAIGLASMDKKSLLPRKGFATMGTILGVIECLPLLVVIGLGAFIYYLCGGKKKTKNK